MFKNIIIELEQEYSVSAYYYYFPFKKNSVTSF